MPRHSAVLLAALLAWTATTAQAQTGRSSIGTQRSRKVLPPEYFKHFQEIKTDGNITRALLRNGLTVLVEEVHSVPLASMVTYVRAGYLDEPDEVVGIAHVIEHMFFKGTTHRPVGEIAKQTRALGGVLNASTIYDRTLYYTTVPAENIEKAIEIQADSLLNPSFDGAELKKEIEVIVQESRRKFDSPIPFALESLYDLAFEQHRMKRWRIGSDAGLRALTRLQLVDFYQRHYTPRNTILVISGSVHREKVLRKIAEHFAGFKRSGGDRSVSPQEPPQQALKYRFLQGDLERGYVMFGYHVPGEEHPDYYALLVLSTMLGEGKASLLNRHVKERSLAQTVGTDLAAFRDTGLLTIFMGLDPGKADSAEAAALAQIESVRRSAPEPYEMLRAIALIEKEFYEQAQQINGRAYQLAHFESLGSYKKRAEFLQKIQKVAAEQVREVANRYLDLSNLSVAEYFPKSAETRSFTSENFRSSAEVLIRAELDRLDKDRPTVDPFAKSIRLPVGDEPFTPNYLRYSLKKSSVLRGPEFYYREDHSLPLVSIGLYFPGGRAQETVDNAGITELALQSALKGTAELESSLLAAQLEILGGVIAAVNEPDFFGYQLEILSAHAEQGMELLLDVVLRPALEEREIEKERSLLLQRIRAFREDNYRFPLQLARSAAYGDHPYGLPGLGTEKSVSSLGAEGVRKWHQRQTRNVLPTFVFYGDFGGTALSQPLIRRLSGEQLQTHKPATPRPAALQGIAEQIAERETRQTALALAFPLAVEDEGEIEALDVYQKVTSGLGGRFFEELRGRQSLAYTVAVLLERHLHGATVFAYIATSPENEARARTGLLSQFQDFLKLPLRDEEMFQARMGAIGSHRIALQERRHYLNEVARNAFGGRGIEAIEKYADTVRGLQSKDIKAIAERFTNATQYGIGIVRGKP